MKYLVIGAGGTGGSIGAFMTEAGKDVTVIDKGKHLEVIQQQGLKMETTFKGNYTVCPMKACSMEHYSEKPDVIFNCVKGYSLEDTIPFIKRTAHKETIIIPLLNIYGTGSRMQEMLPGLLVDIVETNLKILDKLSSTASTSMQRDLKQGKSSEIDGLIFEVVRMGRQYGVPIPTYELIAENFGFKS